ncbi:MAG TPA: hypothetical protein VFY10_02925, partial [Dehalococcoidia bacterium]|nr:hypothetical protein [Dehalococcoidia bacterium]
DDEYNLWYNDFHIRQILKLPGFVAVTRYKLSRVQTEWYPPMSQVPEWPYGRHSYLAIYEIDRTADPAGVFANLQSTESLRQSVEPSADPVEWGEQWFYEAYAGREYPFGLGQPSVPVSNERPLPIWLVPTTPISDEIENEYHKWYSFQGVLRNEGFESVSRYKLSGVQGRIDSRAPEVTGSWPFNHHTFLAVWEVSDVLTAYTSRRRPRDIPAAPGRTPGPRYPWMAVWPSLHHADEHIFYEPITRRIVSPWLELRES